ncbi:MAG: hypothetical protein KKA64_01505 [Nanoarchaeota archaeon]|nr:hypothetical protein [Nanoarchaeota archaeon]
MRKKRVIKNKGGNKRDRKTKMVKSLLFAVIFLALVILVSLAVYNINSSINSNHIEKSIQGYVAVDNADTLGNLEQGIDKGAENLEDIQGKIEGIKETKWDYLGKEWKIILLQNKIVFSIDGLFKQVNFIFVALFGQDYDLSLNLLFAVILWVFFFYNIGVILKNYSAFSQAVSITLGLIMAIILAQFGIYKMISESMLRLIFYKEGIWSGVWFFILFILFILLCRINQASAKITKIFREKSEKEKEKLDRKMLHKVAEELKK